MIVRPLDDITLIYHRPSGQTHLTVSPVPEILDVMQAFDGPMSPAEIVGRLSERFDLGDPDEAQAGVAAHLDELAALGLVRSA
jgi:PqqD family protein of HPr-rel-A system